VVVTGGAGFIGANLCRRLAITGDPVVAFDDLSTGRRENLADTSLPLVEATILDRDALDHAFAGADAVVHLAARASVPRSIAEPEPTHAANATGTLAVLEAVRRAGVGHVVVASSSSVYGANPVLPKHEGLAQLPLSPYAASKLATEAYALAYQQSFGIPVLVFRFFNVFGPRQAADHVYAAVIPNFLAAAVDGRPLVVHGDGRQTRDFTYVDTVTGVIADAVARRVASPGPVNLAGGTRTDLLTLIAQLEAVVGHDLPVEHTAPRVGDVRDSQADVTRLRELFPELELPSLDDALAATYDWFRAEREDAARAG
jgi:UDP-glucose 4-epimerase